MPVSLGLHCTSKLKLLIIASGGQKAGKKEGRGGGVFFFCTDLCSLSQTFRFLEQMDVWLKKAAV